MIIQTGSIPMSCWCLTAHCLHKGRMRGSGQQENAESHKLRSGQSGSHSMDIIGHCSACMIKMER